MANYAELISQFKDVTGTSDDRAKFYLESADWALQVAISSFYESQADADVSPLDNGGDIETVGPSSDSLSLPASTADKMAKNENASGPFKKSVKPRIATLHNMSQRSSDDEEEGQAFYAGGSERSGQQVLGPPKKKNFKEQLTEIFRMAHDSGVVVDPSSQSTASNSRGDSYQGVGLRLGQTEDDHTMVAERNRRTSSENIEPVVLKLWSQGFSINDGELRPYDEPENREFLESVMKGQIPNELRQIGNIVSVDLEDHRHEDYKKPLVETKSFKGSGHILGSPAPNVGDSSKVIVSRTKKDNNQQRATGQLNVDSSQPTTMLQIRLTDGTRISAQFNLSHTIDDIRRYIITTRPQYENQSFILVTAFPTKALTDNTKTIEESGLSNASLMQRLK